MSENNKILINPFSPKANKAIPLINKCNNIFYNYILVSINPNVLALQDNIPTCPICLGYLVKPVKPSSCSHIFCNICLQMWLQKKNFCPLCRKNVDELTNLYFVFEGQKKNDKLNHLFYSIKYLKLDNYGNYSQKCLICGEVEPKDELILCDCCNYFQSHFKCDPPIGLSHGRFYCQFCRKKFIDSLKSK